MDKCQGQKQSPNLSLCSEQVSKGETDIDNRPPLDEKKSMAWAKRGTRQDQDQARARRLVSSRAGPEEEFQPR